MLAAAWEQIHWSIAASIYLRKIPNNQRRPSSSAGNETPKKHSNATGAKPKAQGSGVLVPGSLVGCRFLALAPAPIYYFSITTHDAPHLHHTCHSPYLCNTTSLTLACFSSWDLLRFLPLCNNFLLQHHKSIGFFWLALLLDITI